MKKAIRNRDYEGFARIDPYIRIFWDLAAVVDGCIIIDNRNPIPNCLQRAVSSRLHRSHPGHEAMVDTAQYLWWPRNHRDFVNLCKNCRECTKFCKNLKPMSQFKIYKSLLLLNAPNEELQLDYTGRVQTVQVTKYTSWKLSTASPNIRLRCLPKRLEINKILKFLEK